MPTKTITVVIEIDEDFSHPIESDDDLNTLLIDNNLDELNVTKLLDGDTLSGPPIHFSDRELAERGLPPFAWALDESTNTVIRIERGMMGYFPAPSVEPRHVEWKNGIEGVSPEQADAMHMGSMFGWHVPAAYPKKKVGV